MGTLAPEQPADSNESFPSNLAGIFSFLFDPESAARRVHTKWFWIGPLILFSIISVIASLVIMPMARHVMEIAPLPQGSTPEQFQKGLSIALLVMRVTMYLAPVVAALIFAIQTAVLLGMSAATSVHATFRQLFNLVTGCGIIQGLSALAGVVILKAKGEVSTQAELRPALGLDIFLPEGTNKVLMGVLGYFSVFELWWIVMIALIYSAAFRVSKVKALVVVLPLVLFSILLRVLGAVFGR
jgi:hypothetical protein